jgi:hypothetical protein
MKHKPIRSALRKIVLIGNTVIVIAITGLPSQAQVSNYGGTINVAGQLVVKGNLINTSGDVTVTNNGVLKISGDVVNGSNISLNAGSSLILESTKQQNISGNAINLANLTVNNAAGINLNTDLRISGAVNFTSGNINTGSGLVIFLAGSSIIATPSDASHVNGRVQFNGTGNFIYPVGNNSKYQPVTANLSSNTAGLVASYSTGDAGNGTFTPTGSSSAPLLCYNAKEYWRLDAAGPGTLSGTVTINWDSYNDTCSNVFSERAVAHKVSSTWQNEGGIVTGNNTIGAVTSNTITTWGIFTTGRTSSAVAVSNIIRPDEINVFPNPVLQTLFLKKPESLRIKTIRLIDASGRVVYSGPYMPSISVAHLSPGLYILETRSANNQVMRKSIIRL